MGNMRSLPDLRLPELQTIKVLCCRQKRRRLKVYVKSSWFGVEVRPGENVDRRSPGWLSGGFLRYM